MPLENDTNPLISIVIPNYNNEKYIGECLNSCITQSYKNLEIIVVDDCSTDSSLKIIQSLQFGDSRLKLIINSENKGVTYTRNRGIMEAEGDWVTTLDSDDYYLIEKKISNEVDMLITHNLSKNIIAYSGIVVVDQKGKQLGSVMKKNNTKQGDIFIDLLTRKCAIPRDFIFSKELFIKVNGFDLDIPIYEDWDLKIRMAKQASYLFTGFDGIAYRQLSTGLSSAKKEKHDKWINYVFEKNSEGLSDKMKLKKLLNKAPSLFTKFKNWARTIKN